MTQTGMKALELVVNGGLRIPGESSSTKRTKRETWVQELQLIKHARNQTDTEISFTSERIIYN